MVHVSGQIQLIVFQIEMEFSHIGFQGQIKFIVFQTDISFVRVAQQHLSNYEITPSTGGQWILPPSTIRLKITLLCIDPTMDTVGADFSTSCNRGFLIL